jgi:hypothetical protein
VRRARLLQRRSDDDVVENQAFASTPENSTATFFIKRKPLDYRSIFQELMSDPLNLNGLTEFCSLKHDATVQSTRATAPKLHDTPPARPVPSN